MTERARWWWGTAPSEIRGESTKQYSRQTPVFLGGNGTQVPERTEWHRVLLWRRLAEVVEKYVHSGDKLYIEGQLRTRSYTNKQGQTRYVTEIWADNMEMLTPKSSRSEVAPQSSTSALTDQPEDEKLPF